MKVKLDRTDNTFKLSNQQISQISFLLTSEVLENQ